MPPYLATCLVTGSIFYLLALPAASGGEPLPYRTHFESDPQAAGWRLAGEGFEGGWVGDGAGDGPGALALTGGAWRSPRFEVEPHAYYRVRFHARTASRGSWTIQFFRAGGELITADVYDAVLPGAEGEWTEQVSVIRAHPEAASMHFMMHATPGGIAINDLSIEPVDAQTARHTLAAIASGAPLPRYQPPQARWTHLAKTRHKLESESSLRIVMLGDSICNDTSNALFELLLERDMPGAQIRVITSVRGSTGCTYYREEGRVERYVLRHDPDLLIIAGISHASRAGAIGDVIDQVRAASGAEILVLNGAITPPEVIRARRYAFAELMARRGEDPADIRRRIAETRERAARFPSELARMCREKEVARFDVRAAWDAYIARTAPGPDALMRDSVHANRIGKQVAGHLLYRHLSPRW